MKLPPLWPEHLPKSLPSNTISLGVRILTYEFGGRDTNIQCIALHLSSYGVVYIHTGTSLVAQIVKNLPAMQETQVPSLGQEYLLEKEMATHSSILAGETPWTEKTGGLQSLGSQRVGHHWATDYTQHTYCLAAFPVPSTPPFHVFHHVSLSILASSFSLPIFPFLISNSLFGYCIMKERERYPAQRIWLLHSTVL